MDERQLRAKVEHYKRVASLVTNKSLAEALLELAANYEAVADKLASVDRPGGTTPKTHP
jgi:hypothetical protein